MFMFQDHKKKACTTINSKIYQNDGTSFLTLFSNVFIAFRLVFQQIMQTAKKNIIKMAFYKNSSMTTPHWNDDFKKIIEQE